MKKTDCCGYVFKVLEENHHFLKTMSQNKFIPWDNNITIISLIPNYSITALSRVNRRDKFYDE